MSSTRKTFGICLIGVVLAAAGVFSLLVSSSGATDGPGEAVGEASAARSIPIVDENAAGTAIAGRQADDADTDDLAPSSQPISLAEFNDLRQQVVECMRSAGYEVATFTEKGGIEDGMLGYVVEIGEVEDSPDPTDPTQRPDTSIIESCEDAFGDELSRYEPPAAEAQQAELRTCLADHGVDIDDGSNETARRILELAGSPEGACFAGSAGIDPEALDFE